MAYDLMILADPGPERAAVLRALQNDTRVASDPTAETRFRLTTEHGGAVVSIGTKDPVESIHVEMERADPPLLEAAVRWALALADQLDMRVEDVHWGHEVTAASLPALLEYWAAEHAGRGGTGQPRDPGVTEPARRPWWRLWT